MYIGHYAVAFAAKRAAPKTSLGTLLIASQLIDLIWPLLVLAGIERVTVDPGNTAFTPLDFSHYPITHSLFTVVIWATLLAGVYLYATRYRRGALTVWLAVVSHWILDLVTHRPDLPLYPGSERLVGLGLWNSTVGTLLLEVTLFVVGVSLYTGITKQRDRTGGYALWAMVAFLLITYAANWLGPPPPSSKAVAWSALLLWILVPWAYWVEGHRRLKRL